MSSVSSNRAELTRVPTRSNRTFIPLLVGSLAAAIVCLGGWQANRQASLRYFEEVRAVTIRSLAAIRGAAEIAVNKRVYLTQGLKAYVSVNPDMTPDEFADIAAVFRAEGHGIRSVTSIRDDVIDDVFPREGNEGAIGLKLLKHADQRAAAQHAKETGKAWLAGPVKLVQGGEAFINRSPVYVTEPGGKPGRGRYWGMVSILIDRDKLVNEIAESVPPELAIAIRGRNDLGGPGSVFWGDESIQQRSSIQTDISLPTGSWTLYGVPKAGWPTTAPNAAMRWLATFTIAILVGLLSFANMRATLRYRDYSRRLERVNEALQASREDLKRNTTQLERTNAELERSNVALDEFAHVASHDLRSPLRAIENLSNWLSEDEQNSFSPQSAKYMKLLRGRVGRMDRLLDALLQYARVGRVEHRAEEIECGSLIREIVELIDKPPQFQVVVQGEMPILTTARVPLEQVLRNLMDNAIKHHHRVDGKLTIEARDRGSYVEFEVGDDGPGVEPRYHAQIFDIFETLKPRDEVEGCGMGLAMVKKIAITMGGEITLESDVDQGARFRFTWPKSSLGVAREIAPAASGDGYVCAT